MLRDLLTQGDALASASPWNHGGGCYAPKRTREERPASPAETSPQRDNLPLVVQNAGMTLAERLAALDHDAQGALAREQAPLASTSEVIDALGTDGLGEWAELHLIYELTHRDSALVEPIGRALLAQPTGRASRALSEALVQLFSAHRDLRDRVIALLIDAGGAALDQGASTHQAGTYVIKLADCAALQGGSPEARPLAQRLLQLAATEAEPYSFAVGEAEKLASARDA